MEGGGAWQVVGAMEARALWRAHFGSDRPPSICERITHHVSTPKHVKHPTSILNRRKAVTDGLCRHVRICPGRSYQGKGGVLNESEKDERCQRR
ncbi:hypothetical protein BDW22DRAFT_1362887, partial [Trametopsis cervina]